LVEDRPLRTAEYWRIRAQALEEEIAALQALVLHLADELAPEQVARAMEAANQSAIVLPAGGDAARPTPSDIETELDRLWASLMRHWICR
jgi:uncharacterized protein